MTAKGQTHSFWTPEEDARLMEARENGLTLVAIATVLGRTENAVSTRIKRLHIPKVHKKQNKVLKSGVFGSGFGAPQKIVRKPEAFIAYGTPKTLLELKAGECKFHVDKMGFCAAPCYEAYCEKHRKICYVSA